MTPRRRLLVLVGLAASLVLAGTVVWQVAWEAYHLRRLREDPARCRALVAVSESSSAGRAMRRFLRRPDGVKALLDTLSATVTPAARSLRGDPPNAVGVGWSGSRGLRSYTSSTFPIDLRALDARMAELESRREDHDDSEKRHAGDG